MSFQDPIECYQAIAEELAAIVKPDGSKESNVDPVRLDEYFFGLADLVSTPGKGHYKTCTFQLEPDGEFKVDFTY